MQTNKTYERYKSKVDRLPEPVGLAQRPAVFQPLDRQRGVRDWRQLQGANYLLRSSTTGILRSSYPAFEMRWLTLVSLLVVDVRREPRSFWTRCWCGFRNHFRRLDFLDSLPRLRMLNIGNDGVLASHLNVGRSLRFAQSIGSSAPESDGRCLLLRSELKQLDLRPGASVFRERVQDI